jgi:hypothetical protein
MNLVEAVKTGKRFKRKDWTETEWMTSDGRFTVDAETLTADDWEVEHVPVTITREQFDAAWNKAIADFDGLWNSLPALQADLRRRLNL